MKNKKPPKCCHPDCLRCPYSDCRYDRLEESDYTESNNRDYEHYEAYTGEKLHRKLDKVYRNGRQNAYHRNHRKYYDRHKYNQQYYAEHGEEIREKSKEKYSTEENTRKCRRYRKANLDKRKEYERLYYETHKEQIKERARERYQIKKKLISGG